jgi:hypothetical protein
MMCMYKHDYSKHPSLFAWYFLNHSSKVARDTSMKLLLRIRNYKIEFSLTIEEVKYG